MTRLAVPALCACAIATAGHVRAATRDVAPDEIRGTITVHGSDTFPDTVMVRARPVLGPAGSGRPSPGAGRTFVERATRLPGQEPFRFTFRIRGLAPDVPYRIGMKVIQLAGENRPRLVWSSDRDPLLRAGDPIVEFDAHAVRAELEVLGPAVGRDRPMWVGADALNFEDATQAERMFRWRTTLPGVTGGRLQVSLDPFPRVAQPDYHPCRGTEDGMVYTEDFPLDLDANGWATLPPVDFNRLLMGSGRTGGDPVDGEPPLGGAFGPAALNPNWDTVVLPKLQAGHPIYVRVLPMAGDDVQCDPDRTGTPPEVILAVIKAIEASQNPDPRISVGLVYYTKPWFSNHPNENEIYYRFTKPHTLDWFASSWDLMAINSGPWHNGDTVYPGAYFWVSAGGGNDGWFESFTEGLAAAVTGFIDAVGNLVNYSSKLWEQIQDSVVDAVADVVPFCNQTCRDALETGLEIGLTTMGVPPSLPNFDELTDKGLEYLADQALAQTGLPDSVKDIVEDYSGPAAKAFIKELTTHMRDNFGLPGLPDWLAPDIRFTPAHLEFEIYGPGTDHPFGSRPGLARLGTPIYAQGPYVLLPRHLPKFGEEPPLVVPMVLPSNNAGLPEPPLELSFNSKGQLTYVPKNEYKQAIWFKDKWIKLRFLPPWACYDLHLTALSDPGGVYEIFSAAFDPKNASAACIP